MPDVPTPRRLARRSMVAALVLAAAGVGVLPAAAQDAPAVLCSQNPPDADFVDRGDIRGVHRANVDCLAQLEITRGLADDQGVVYRPWGEVRRDQMASFLARALRASGAELPSPSSQGFVDTVGNAHLEAIEQLAQIGVAEGVTAERYAPAQSVRRDQMASFLVRAIAWAQGRDVEELQGADVPFTDVEGSVHRDNIAGLAELGVTAGVGDGRFAPDQTVSRQEMATFLTRTLGAVVGSATALCRNADAGYQLAYPVSWQANDDDVIAACRVFDPRPFTLQPGTEIPLDLAITIGDEAVEFAEAVNAATRGEVLRREAITVDGRDAVVAERRDGGDGLLPAGTLVYQYVIDVGDAAPARTLLATTTSLGGDYPRNVSVLDQMVETIDLGD